MMSLLSFYSLLPTSTPSLSLSSTRASASAIDVRRRSRLCIWLVQQEESCGADAMHRQTREGNEARGHGERESPAETARERERRRMRRWNSISAEIAVVFSTILPVCPPTAATRLGCRASSETLVSLSLSWGTAVVCADKDDDISKRQERRLRQSERESVREKARDQTEDAARCYRFCFC